MDSKQTISKAIEIIEAELKQLETRRENADELVKASTIASTSTYMVAKESYARGRKCGMSEGLSHLKRVLHRVKILETETISNQGE